MFGTLAKYAEAGYAFAHALLTFRTLYDEKTSYYVPVAAFHASMLEGEAGYFDVTPMNFDTEDAFQAYLEAALKRSAWISPADVSVQDEMLMLLTCSYYHADGRFVLLCRRLREGETPEGMRRLFDEAAQGQPGVGGQNQQKRGAVQVGGPIASCGEITRDTPWDKSGSRSPPAWSQVDVAGGRVEEAGNMRVDDGGTGVLHVAGFTTWNSVSGSPVIHQSHMSPSPGPYTLPMVSSSMVMPCMVSIVTTATCRCSCRL